MADGKIYITISDTRLPGKKPEPTPEEIAEKEKKKRNQFLAHEAVHFIKSQATNMANYSISNIGNFTGSYQTQRDVENSISLASSLTGILTSIIAAAPYGVGAATVTAIISTASVAINKGMEIHSYNFQIKKQNHDIEILRKISGMDALTNGSRI